MTLELDINRLAVDWLADGRRVVAATLVEALGSSPLDPGATMLVDDQGRIEGSVTGGCVEGALFEEAQAVLAGEGPRVRTYGISDSEAAGVGLMCGGTVVIFVHELPAVSLEALRVLADAVSEGRDAALATLLDGDAAGSIAVVVDGRRLGSLGVDPRLDAAIEREAMGCLAHGTSVMRRFGRRGEVMGDDLRVFIRAYAKRPAMVIFGAIDFSAAMATFAKHLGYEVTICDARPAFAAASRFQVADHVVVDWPDRYLAERILGPRDVVLVFTHDPKFDEPALVAALDSGAGYIGALGSRQTHEDRRRRLLEAGVSEDALERVAAPCGLDIGARTPEETAVSVLAEILASSVHRSGRPLVETSGSIHPPRDARAAQTGTIRTT